MDPVVRLHNEFKDIIEFLAEKSDLTLLNTLEENFRKAVLLSSASLFEHEITTCVLKYCAEATNNNNIIYSIVKTKAISRQYHTWFEWDSSNVNRFYGIMGGEFGKEMKKYIEKNSMGSSVKAFLELGRERNKLVHGNYASFPIEKTAQELFNSYLDAKKFVESIPVVLKLCGKSAGQETEQKEG